MSNHAPKKPHQTPVKPTINSVSKRSFGWAEWLSTFAIFAATLVAIGQYFIVSSQLDVMQADERAWIVVDFNDPPPQQATANQPLVNMIRFSNTGKTPARKVTFSFTIEDVKPNQLPTFIYDDSSKKGEMGALFPNAPQKVRVETPTTLTATDYEDLATGKAYVALYGVINYYDIFGVQHWNKFCTWIPLGGDGAYLSRTCVDYNDVDDNRQSRWQHLFASY